MQNLCHSCKLFKTIFVANCLLKQMIKIHRFLSLRQNSSDNTSKIFFSALLLISLDKKPPLKYALRKKLLNFLLYLHKLF